MSPLAWQAATYDGEPLLTFVGTQPRLIIWLINGLDSGAEYRGEDTIIPGVAGRTARNRVRDRRVIELTGYVIGTGDNEDEQMDDLRTAIEELRALFDGAMSTAKVLVIDLEDGGQAVIGARTVNWSVVQTEDPVIRALSAELEAIGGDWAIDLSPVGSFASSTPAATAAFTGTVT